MGLRLACCIEAPCPYVPKARYALRMLLAPLGIDPYWVERKELGRAGIYYGLPAVRIPESIVRIALSKDAVAYFETGDAYPAQGVGWRIWWQERWPVLFGDDLFASAFFWLSGWQEHVVSGRDRHARFQHAASLQASLGTTTRPCVDAYRERLAEMLERSGLRLQRRQWQDAAWALCPTFDIDYLRKWRRGMIFREAVQYFLLNYRKVSIAGRWHRFGRFLADWLRPSDVYRESLARLHAECARYGTGTFLFKAGAHGPNDVAYRMDDPFLARTILALERDGFEVGVHGSYYAHAHEEYLAAERRAVALATRTAPVSVRQHFLRYEAPATHRLQERLGFRIDSTLAFSETEGFRHSTCLPFQVFDVHANACTQIWEMPLAVMESALFNRRGLSVEEAMRATHDILQTCRRFRGVAVLLWHNILWDALDHPGWDEHYRATLRVAAGQGARVMSMREALDAWLQSSAALFPAS